VSAASRPRRSHGRFQERLQRRLIDRLVGAPDYPPEPADLATFSILGLRLPVRATLVIAIVTFVLILDQQYDFLPRDVPFGHDAQAMRAQSLERLVLFGLIPLVALLLLRQDPRRYGVRLGDWRRGVAWMLIAGAVMTPVIALAATVPSIRDYYAVSIADPLNLTITNVLDLAPSEFLFRGFLMFALLRVMGPIGVVVATMPFVYAHLQKPEIELLSTLFGGTAFGWLAWQTGSIWYGTAVHVFIVTLLITLAGGH
jgi:membrane protease YdiL (CAAX protease family)